MQAGSLVSNDVMVFSSRVVVDGVLRPHESWSVARDLVGDLPDQVVAGGGIRQATGSVSWASSGDVSDGSLNPWNGSSGWLPTSGQSVQIFVGDGVSEWLQFVGVIDQTTGDVGGGFESSIVDLTDRLNVLVSHPTVFEKHPPALTSATREPTYPGMGPGYVADYVMRAAGFFSTPKREPGAVLDVPCQTSVWPHLGYMRNSQALPSRRKAPWGWSVGDVSSGYNPTGSLTTASDLQMTIVVDPEHSGFCRYAASFTPSGGGESFSVYLEIDPDRFVTANTSSGSAVSLMMNPGDSVLSLLVRGNAWTLRTVSKTLTGTRTRPTGFALDYVTLFGDANTRVAGLQVSSPAVGKEFASLNHVPTFVPLTGSLSNFMSATRSFDMTPGREVMDEISSATLAPFWFDETGAVRMISSDLLRAQPPVQTLTTLNDVTKLGWEKSLLGVRSKTTVKYDDPAITIASRSTINLWQGSSEPLDSKETYRAFAAEPSSEDWAEIGELRESTFPWRVGTLMLSYLEDSDGNSYSSAGKVTWSMTKVGNETMLFTATAGTIPSDRTLILGTHRDNTTITIDDLRGAGMPLLRGRGRAIWNGQGYTSTVQGPSGFPELVHEAQHWLSIEGSTSLQAGVANYIANQTKAPQPTITGLEVVYDPRRQLGDVILISSPDYMGIELRALVVGVRNSASDSYTQSLTVRIISAKTTFTTYAEHEAAYPDSLTYQQWQALYPDTTTYSDFNADPLKGAS